MVPCLSVPVQAESRDSICTRHFPAIRYLAIRYPSVPASWILDSNSWIACWFASLLVLVCFLWPEFALTKNDMRPLRHNLKFRSGFQPRIQRPGVVAVLLFCSAGFCAGVTRGSCLGRADRALGAGEIGRSRGPEWLLIRTRHWCQYRFLAACGYGRPGKGPAGALPDFSL